MAVEEGPFKGSYPIPFAVAKEAAQAFDQALRLGRLEYRPA